MITFNLVYSLNLKCLIELHINWMLSLKKLTNKLVSRHLQK